MQARYVILASALSAAVLGIGITWADFGRTPALEVGESLAPPPAAEHGVPKLLVDSRTHNFGAVERDSKVKHAFQFTNVGDGVLSLKPGATSCSACTIADVTKSELSPGETADVIVEYTANSPKSDFRQIATVLTNDPERPRVELGIVGAITSKFRVLPGQLILSGLPANEPYQADIRILCFLANQMKVAEHEMVNEETAPYFEITSEPLAKDELSDPQARSGCRLLVTVKPGLPLGPFRQTIRLTLQAGDKGETTVLTIPVEGTVVSGYSIVGPGWQDDIGVLTLGSVESAKGARRDVALLMRGAHRREAQVTVKQVDPPWLKVDLGEPQELNKSVVRVPVTVEIPPGRPPVIRLGSDQGKYGQVILGVKDPDGDREIHMHLKFVIYDSQAERD